MFNLFKRPKILTFKDLAFKEDEISKSARVTLVSQPLTDEQRNLFNKMLNMKSARIEFSNGYFISVKLGSMFHSNGVDTYEVYSNLDRQCLNYVTSEEITEFLIKIQNA